MLKLLRLPLILIVLIYQSFMLALGQIWSNKVRSALTMLGIIIGVASVTAVIAALTGLQKKVLADLEAMGTNKIFVYPERPSTGPRRTMGWHQLRFRPHMFDDLLKQCPSIRSFARTTWVGSTVRYGDKMESDVGIQGIESAWHKIENRSVVMGRPFSVIDNEQGRAVCLINEHAQRKLALPKDCIGTSIMLDGRRFAIVGVVEPSQQSSMMGGNQSVVEVFIPFATAWSPDSHMNVVVAAKSPQVAEEAQAELTHYLRGKRRQTPVEPDTFRLNAVQKFIDSFKETSTTMMLVATGIVSISLLVGGVGIMNIMLVSVSERTREIGLRKALGARPAAILLQFLVEAITLCLLGGLIGLLGGKGLAHLMSTLPGAKLDQAEIPFWAVLLSFGFAATTGLVFGMLPAIKAARLDPIEALRHP